MGCGASSSGRAYIVQPAAPGGEEEVCGSVGAAADGLSYSRLVETPGGSVVQTRGFAIDHRLPPATPGGSAVDRRDYDRDPLTAVEAAEIQRCIDKARTREDYFAETPLALRRPWTRRVLQTPTSISSVTGKAELRYTLPQDVCGGQELVLQTPRGTLVDVAVPEHAGPGAELVVRYVPLPRFDSQGPESETPEGAGTGLLTGSTRERREDALQQKLQKAAAAPGGSPGLILDAPPPGRKRLGNVATGVG
eukprot:SAG22_NODE_506_length_9643_cov_5.853206_11_plen_250_part_00